MTAESRKGGTRRRGRLPVLLLVGAALAATTACERPSERHRREVEARGAATASMVPVADAGVGDAGPAAAAEDGVAATRTPTSDWSDRRAIEAMDAAFPHSAHRALDCARCHRRPATHVTHGDAACTGCHGRPTELASAPPVAGAQCAACHHQRATANDCATCHDREQLAPRPVLASVVTAGGASVRVRRLSFAHERHAGVACTRCHAEPATRRFDDDCSLCHAVHHRREASCIACHDGGQVAAHDNTVHGGCAGGGCHEAANVASLAGTRNVCLSCHRDRVEHEQGRECGACHVGLLASPGAVRPGARPRSSAGSGASAGGRQ